MSFLKIKQQTSKPDSGRLLCKSFLVSQGHPFLSSADTSRPQVFWVLRARDFLSLFYINHLKTFIECRTVSQELGREGLMKHNPSPCEVSCWVLILSSLALGFVWMFISKGKKKQCRLYLYYEVQMFKCRKCLGILSRGSVSQADAEELQATARHLRLGRKESWWMSTSGHRDERASVLALNQNLKHTFLFHYMIQKKKKGKSMKILWQ